MGHTRAPRGPASIRRALLYFLLGWSATLVLALAACGGSSGAPPADGTAGPQSSGGKPAGRAEAARFFRQATCGATDARRWFGLTDAQRLDIFSRRADFNASKRDLVFRG